MSLRMREILSNDECLGHLEARIEPSSVLDKRTGILVSINKHFELKDQTELPGARIAISILDAEFNAALRDADEIINHFVEMASQ